MLEDEDAAARLADVEPIAERHLERDLDAGRARVREEGASERGGGDADQFGGEGFGGFVRPAGEDELVELFGLVADCRHDARSEEHTSELQSLMRHSYAVFCLKKKKHK